MKRITLIILSVAAILAGSVSCQKVNDLDKRLTQLEQTVSDLKAQVLAGAVITSVDKTADGCTFTLSNGQFYTVTNGKNGSDGEAIIADVKIEENFIVLTLKDGETLRISYQNPLSMVTLNIVPDYDDGTVGKPETVEAIGMKSHIFYLDISVTPAKYTEILSDTEKFIHKAVFSPVLTKSGFGNAFTVSPKSVIYAEDAPVPFLEASFELDDEIASLLQNNNSAYTVSYVIEDKDGAHGAATAFVTITHDKGSVLDAPTDGDDKAEAMDYIRKIAADAISKIKNMDVSYDVTGRAEVNINQVVLDAELSIERSTSKAEIDEAKEVAEKTIQWIIVDVENEYSKELDEAKARALAEVQAKAEVAKAEINEFEVEKVPDYVKDDAKSNIDKAVAEANAAIASATSKNCINEAKNKAIDQIKFEVDSIRPTS